jgi:hypothetical protein
MSDWSDWIQDVGKSTINTIVEAQYKSPVDLQKMQLQLLGQYGTPYVEGSTNTAAAVAAQQQAMFFGIPMPLLLIGGVLYLLAKD